MAAAAVAVAQAAAIPFAVPAQIAAVRNAAAAAYKPVVASYAGQYVTPVAAQNHSAAWAFAEQMVTQEAAHRPVEAHNAVQCLVWAPTHIVAVGRRLVAMGPHQLADDKLA